MSIGDNIKKYRGTMKQTDFAEQLGVTSVTVSRWETGQNVPNGEMLQKMAQVLGVSVDKLMEGQHMPQTKELNERSLKEDYGMMIYQFTDNEALKMPATPDFIPIFEKIVAERLKMKAV